MSLFRGSPVIADEVTLSSVWPGQFGSIVRVAKAAEQWPCSIRDLDCMSKGLIGIVAERRAGMGAFEMIGYGFYLHKDARRTKVALIVVHPRYRRFGIGRKILTRISHDAALAGRGELLATVDERSDETILFFAACGMRSFRVDRDAYRDANGVMADGYQFKSILSSQREPECVGR
jgi:GNAT superfamily N-acetyltransferase